MKIVRNDKVFCCDVDGTLVKMFAEDYESDTIVIEYMGDVRVRPIEQHINALKELKAKDYYIVVWSHSGPEWAEKVVKALSLEDSVDLIITKPSIAADDEYLKIPPYTKHIFLNEVGDNIYDIAKCEATTAVNYFGA